MNGQIIYLSIEELFSIAEVRYENCMVEYADILNEEDNSDYSGKYVSKEFSDYYKSFKKRFSSEMKLLKLNIKLRNTKEAKASIKKLNTMIDEMEDKIKKTPEEKCGEYFKRSIIALGLTILVNLGMSIGHKLNIDNFKKESIQNLSNTIKQYAQNYKDPNWMAANSGENSPYNQYKKNAFKIINDTKFRKNAINIATIITGIAGFVYSIKLKADFNKKDMLNTLDIYKKKLNELSSKLQ